MLNKKGALVESTFIAILNFLCVKIGIPLLLENQKAVR
jgi:hypothetical protein